jgi:XTP/dITP diphosphohydrolase
LPKLVLATGNSNKVYELKELLAGLSFTITTIGDYPGLIMPEEDQPTFAGNAALKAEAVSNFCDEIALADDSGLEVEALGGRPGVYSARYAGEEGNYAANNRLLLQELSGLPLSSGQHASSVPLRSLFPAIRLILSKKTAPVLSLKNHGAREALVTIHYLSMNRPG